MRHFSPHLRAVLPAVLLAAATGCGKGTATAATETVPTDTVPTPEASACLPDVATFEARVWKPVLAYKCATCHSATGVAAGTRFVLVTTEGADAAQANLTASARMALATEEGEPLLLRRSTGTHHVGGTVVQPGDADYQALADFVGRARGDATACGAASRPPCESGDPGARLIRRLSRREYDATLRDVLGVTRSYASTLVPDLLVHGFDNNAGALAVSPLLALQLRNAAEEVGAMVAARPERACATDGLACARAFLQDTGARLLRRPLATTEVTRWLAVYQAGAAEPPTGETAHQSGLATMIAGLLQSPSFLYRTELGALDAATGRFVLDPYEVASELSYLLWAAPPDDELWQAAGDGSLADVAAIAAQAARLLASPRARGSLDRFAAQWLTVDELAIAPKDPGVYPELTLDLRAAMAEELGRVVAAHTVGGSTLAELLTSPQTFVDAPLASFYGVAPPATPDASGFGEVAGRGGLLTLGAVLTAHGRPNASSPISRGKLVREQLLCQVLPTPPSGVVAQPPALDPSLTTRERYRQHSDEPACASCHRLVDPIGFGLEHFDGVGRYRGTENGLAIDESGEVLATPATNGTFTGAAALASLLAGSSDVQACFSLQWLRWAYGITEGPKTSCLVDDVRAQFARKGNVVRELVLALTQASHFRYRLADAADGGGDSGGGGDAGGGGSGGGGSGGGDSGGGGGSTPGDTPGVTATLTRTNSWTSGYCATLRITSTSSAPVTWRVTVTVEGAIYTHWNCDLVVNGNQVTFTGVAFNGTVPPGGTAEAGFCANL